MQAPYHLAVLLTASGSEQPPLCVVDAVLMHNERRRDLPITKQPAW